METQAARTPERWCVITVTGHRHLVDYVGYAPVSVWENGLLEYAKYRHRPEGSPCGPACEAYPLAAQS
ncbi:hypothetical protein [Streptomyces sp. NPDC002088]|uniref:hypothetical protein n=1 Tax=Streptomyces sp. NPDC002088 TaxID=3154665 RepID=UPI003332C114